MKLSFPLLFIGHFWVWMCEWVCMCVHVWLLVCLRESSPSVALGKYNSDSDRCLPLSDSYPPQYGPKDLCIHCNSHRHNNITVYALCLRSKCRRAGVERKPISDSTSWKEHMPLPSRSNSQCTTVYSILHLVWLSNDCNWLLYEYCNIFAK